MNRDRHFSKEYFKVNSKRYRDILIKEDHKAWGNVWYMIHEDNHYHFALYMYHDDPSTIYLSNVFVNEKYRRNGYGNQILNYAEIFASHYKCEKIILNVLYNSFAYKWYLSKGYEFFEDNGKDYIWLVKYI